MADTWFSAKEWKARLVEFAGRRSLRNVANGETTTYDVSRSEGQVSQEGDAFNTKNMNDLEQRVANGFANAKTAVDTLNRDLGRVNVYVGSDGKLHFVNSGGADSVLPFNNKPAYYTVSTGRELAVSTYAEESIKITIPDRDGKTAVGGYITNIRVYNSNGDLQEAPIRCNYANKVLTVISSAGKWSSGWTAYYFDVVGIYI